LLRLSLFYDRCRDYFLKWLGLIFSTPYKKKKAGVKAPAKIY
jgi:hypothetical protein